MIRYIEEEAIIKAIDESGQRYGITTANRCNFKEIVRKTPTADVAPKSEVAMEIFEELERTVMHPNWASQNYKNWYFAELKKKYTGDEE